jgi:hypothetical protein
VKLSLAACLVRLLGKFPVEFFSAEFPKIVQVVCKNLNNLEYKERESTKHVLCEMLAITREPFFFFILKEIQ